MDTRKTDSHKFLAVMERSLRALLLLFCIGFVLLDLYIILSRIFFKYELEWLEGDSLIEVNRILAGAGLYVKPSVNFVSLIYPPIYFYVGALFAKVGGLGFGPLRLVSFLSTIICSVVLFRMVKEKTIAWFAALLAIGCFASMFMITGQWFDIARVDMLAVALAFVAVFMAREREAKRNPWNDVASGALFSLAFLTKQHALIPFLAIAAYYLIFNQRILLNLVIGFVLTTAILFGYFWVSSEGWIGYYLFQVPAGHTFDFQIGSAISALISEFSPIPIFLLAAIIPLIIAPRQVWSDKLLRYYFSATAGLIAMGTIGYLNKYATRNVFVPSYLGIALLVGLEAGWLVDWIRRKSTVRLGASFLAVDWLVLIVQLSGLLNAFLSIKTIPTTEDLAAGNALVERISLMPGDVVIPRFGYLSLFAGKPSFYGEIAMSEFRGQGNQYPLPEWPDLHTQIVRTIHSQQTSAIILDYYEYMQDDLTGCKKQQIPYPDNTTFIPVAGAKSRPNFIFTCH